MGGTACHTWDYYCPPVAVAQGSVRLLMADPRLCTAVANLRHKQVHSMTKLVLCSTGACIVCHGLLRFSQAMLNS